MGEEQTMRREELQKTQCFGGGDHDKEADHIVRSHVEACVLIVRSVLSGKESRAVEYEKTRI